MVNAYIQEIQLHISKVQVAQDVLEAKVTDGCKDGAILEPLIVELSKSIEGYNDNMKAIRQAYVPWFNLLGWHILAPLTVLWNHIEAEPRAVPKRKVKAKAQAAA